MLQLFFLLTLSISTYSMTRAPEQALAIDCETQPRGCNFISSRNVIEKHHYLRFLEWTDFDKKIKQGLGDNIRIKFHSTKEIASGDVIFQAKGIFVDGNFHTYSEIEEITVSEEGFVPSKFAIPLTVGVFVAGVFSIFEGITWFYDDKFDFRTPILAFAIPAAIVGTITIGLDIEDSQSYKVLLVHNF